MLNLFALITVFVMYVIFVVVLAVMIGKIHRKNRRIVSLLKEKDKIMVNG